MQGGRSAAASGALGAALDGVRPLAGPGEVVQAGEVRQARLESLRACAALAVLVGHVWGTSHDYGVAATETFGARVILGGGYGVCLFFALTGYLLTWPFVRALFGDGGAIDLRRYALNRVLRIVPLYYAVVVVLLVAQGGGTVEQWWRFGLFAQNFSRDTILTLDGPMWSLVVEVDFYLVLPAAMWLLGRLARGSLTRAAVLVGAAGLASAAVWLATVSLADAVDPLWQYNLPATFYLFAAGMLLAMLRLAWTRGTPPRGLAGRRDLWFAAAAVLWLAACWRYELVVLTAVASFLTVGACVLPLRRGALGLRLLDLRPLALVGIVSYTLYLTHVPVIDRLEDVAGVPGAFGGLLAVVLPAAIAVAIAGYALVEAPFLRLRTRWTAR